jgi:hypothetical protein
VAVSFCSIGEGDKREFVDAYVCVLSFCRIQQFQDAVAQPMISMERIRELAFQGNPSFALSVSVQSVWMLKCADVNV